MMFVEIIQQIGDSVLAVFFSGVLITSLVLTVKLRFIQVRMIPLMLRLLLKSMIKKDVSLDQSSSLIAIPSYKALFAAMSTTIGIGNIVGPAIAVRLGGPGALLGFLLALFLGAATTFAEVSFALIYRKKNVDGSFSGGPMHYIKEMLGSFWATGYALMGALLLAVWCGNQSNTLSDIIAMNCVALNSSCLSFTLSIKAIMGVVLALIVMYYLFSGIKKIGDFSTSMVPVMFFIYCGACLIVLISHWSQLPAALFLIVKSAFAPQAVTGAAAGYSIQQLLRWGLAKGTQAGEAGVGTATIPHSQSTSNNPVEQGIISMVSLYSVGLVCFMSGLVTIVSGVLNDPAVPMGIPMIAVPFQNSFPFSSLVLALSAFLFAIGTVLGNGFNGGHCFSYLTQSRWMNWYYAMIGLIVFLGSVVSVEFIWSITDFFIIPVALINLIAVVKLVFKFPEKLSSPRA